MNNNELYHEGLKGMKWGVRKGPPYPLGRSQMTPAEKRESKNRRKEDRVKASRFAVRNAIKLNKYDQRNARARFKADKATEKASARMDKLSNKADKLIEQGKYTDRRREKILNKAKKYKDIHNRKIAKYAEKSRHYNAMIDNTIRDLDKKGFTVKSREVDRYVNYGRMAGKYLLADLATTPIALLVNPMAGVVARYGAFGYEMATDPKMKKKGRSYLVGYKS